jgi:prolyl oligopeptidase
MPRLPPCEPLRFALTALLLILTACTTMPNHDQDPYLWLEDVLGDRALTWVRERNAQSQALLTSRPEYGPIRGQLLEVLNARDRIPYVTRRADWLYNFWQDEAHPRGLWRRTTIEEYRKPQPQWQLVLDLDALAQAEGENWVWGSPVCLGPGYRRCLLQLSRGGADAKVVREFDIEERHFVTDGFSLPEAKSDVEWIDDDTVYVATDFGPGSMTDSGYPRVVKRWRRGTPLESAQTVFEGQPQDVSAGVWVDRTPGYERTVFVRSLDFYNRQVLLLQGETLVPLDVPGDAMVHFMRDSMLLWLRSDFAAGGTVFPAGSLLVTDAARYLAGERRLQALFTPTPTRSLAGYAPLRDHVVLNVLDNVASKLERWTRHASDDFSFSDIPAPFPGTLGVTSLHDELVEDDPLGNHYLLSYTDFLTPDSLLLGQADQPERELLKSLAPRFDASGMRAEQRFATSRDGTRVPYFVVWPKDARPDGLNPTLLYGYGGFEIALQPRYSGGLGRAWLERGGVYVVANIRGGGEFGPAWHQAAIKADKQKSYDDFIAVAEDLVAQGITTPRHLGIEGGSNGGLLVGAVFTQRPELFGAVVCQVPLLDMQRFHKLLAGASWMAEYGNPDDPADWSVISRYSPYHQVRRGVRYPRVLFTTSTRDDRVHPAHARKMVARMMEQGHEPLYYENIEGGHGGAADNEQRAHLQALEFAFLWQELGR